MEKDVFCSKDITPLTAMPPQTKGGKEMSCKNCEAFQDTNLTSCYRWKNANVEMRGCSEHLKEIFNALNDHQEYEQAKSLVDEQGRIWDERYGVLKEGGR